MSPRHILVRIAALVAILVLGDLVAQLWETPDANIGLGLLVFAACFAVAGVFGVIDGRRGGGRSLVIGWLVVAVVVGILGAVKISLTGWLEGGGFFGDVLLSDLGSVAPFLAVLVALPALVGTAVGAAARPPRAQPAQPRS